jgi:hypothetical protein
MNANKKANYIFYLLSIAVTASGQSVPPQASQHGLNVYNQTTYLFETPEDQAACANRGAELGRLLAQAAALGLDPLAQVKAPTADASAPCVQFQTWVERLPEDYAESVLGGYTTAERGAVKSTLHRFVRDNFRKLYVRYAITVEKTPEAGTYRVSFADSNAALPADVRADWSVVSPKHYPAPQLVKDGDQLPLDLAATDRGIELVDYIHIGRMDTLAKRTDAARDSYAEDSEFTLSRPRLRVNGTARLPVTFPESIRGGVMWLYVPGEGRYIVTFAPHPEFGFEKEGEVSGGLMTLVAGGNVVRIESQDRIAPGGGVYNVYGKLDPDWEPADAGDRERFMAGTSPGVETAVGGK